MRGFPRHAAGAAAADERDAMLELNPYYNRITDLEGRAAALRGYL